jgi:hypothetical protein
LIDGQRTQWVTTVTDHVDSDRGDPLRRHSRWNYGQ